MICLQFTSNLIVLLLAGGTPFLAMHIYVPIEVLVTFFSRSTFVLRPGKKLRACFYPYTYFFVNLKLSSDAHTPRVSVVLASLLRRYKLP